MSWDVFLHKFSRRYSSVDLIPHDEQPLPLGSVTNVQKAVSDVFPGTNWDDPTWGIHDGEFGSVEFNVGEDDPVQSLALHVRADKAIIGGVLQLCERMDCQAIDGTESNFLDQSENPSSGLEKWLRHRNQNTPKSGD